MRNARKWGYTQKWGPKMRPRFWKGRHKEFGETPTSVGKRNPFEVEAPKLKKNVRENF